MPNRVRDVKDVVEDVYDVLVGVEHEASIEVCLTILADLLGTGLSSDELRHIIQQAQDDQGYN
jgi:hypothetical protein